MNHFVRRRNNTLGSILYTFVLLTSFVGVTPAVTHDNADFFPPVWGGGFQLMNANNGYGEPLNVIISGKSSPEVLTNKGFLNWARSLGFSHECLGLHGGGYMSANLGDGRGWVNQIAVLRESYSSAHLGTCLETFVGGNHFRLFRQNGLETNTGALFLAVSHEEDLGDKHKISPDGYDLGRDELVATATSGVTEYDDVKYTATSRDLTGLLEEGTKWINHGISIDGVVKLLTITIVAKDDDDD
ncbi:hypothetical protein ACEPAI_7469 [Sanghuangporus weigelae]